MPLSFIPLQIISLFIFTFSSQPYSLHFPSSPFPLFSHFPVVLPEFGYYIRRNITSYLKSRALFLYYLESTAKQMKKESFLFRYNKEPFLETDIEDSSPLARPPLSRPRRNRPRKYAREVKQGQPVQIKLFRFSLKQSKKTLRVPCYEEDLLNLPHRFTRRLNEMAADNDVETDEELTERETKRCESWLRAAIQDQNTSQ